MPVMPNELTPTAAGASSGHGSSSRCTRTACRSQAKAGVGSAQCRDGGSVLWCRLSAALMTPAMPAVPSVCPMLVLTEPTFTGRSAGRPAAKTAAMADSSTGSPTAVPVPCAST
ncbi:hypothetical protein GCM10020001_063300 [Nonomuraea salmonea]